MSLVSNKLKKLDSRYKTNPSAPSTHFPYRQALGLAFPLDFLPPSFYFFFVCGTSSFPIFDVLLRSGIEKIFATSNSKMQSRQAEVCKKIGVSLKISFTLAKLFWTSFAKRAVLAISIATSNIYDFLIQLEYDLIIYDAKLPITIQPLINNKP